MLRPKDQPAWQPGRCPTRSVMAPSVVDLAGDEKVTTSSVKAASTTGCQTSCQTRVALPRQLSSSGLSGPASQEPAHRPRKRRRATPKDSPAGSLVVCLDEDENGSEEDAQLQAALKASLTEQGVRHKPGAWVWCQQPSTRVFAQVLQCFPGEQGEEPLAEVRVAGDTTVASQCDLLPHFFRGQLVLDASCQKLQVLDHTRDAAHSLQFRLRPESGVAYWAGPWGLVATTSPGCASEADEEWGPFAKLPYGASPAQASAETEVAQCSPQAAPTPAEASTGNAQWKRFQQQRREVEEADDEVCQVVPKASSTQQQPAPSALQPASHSKPQKQPAPSVAAKEKLQSCAPRAARGSVEDDADLLQDTSWL